MLIATVAVVIEAGCCAFCAWRCIKEHRARLALMQYIHENLLRIPDEVEMQQLWERVNANLNR